MNQFQLILLLTERRRIVLATSRNLATLTCLLSWKKKEGELERRLALSAETAILELAGKSRVSL